jgi:hypothetical protein
MYRVMFLVPGFGALRKAVKLELHSTLIAHRNDFTEARELAFLTTWKVTSQEGWLAPAAEMSRPDCGRGKLSRGFPQINANLRSLA